jgi:hypothetical protein
MVGDTPVFAFFFKENPLSLYLFPNLCRCHTRRWNPRFLASDPLSIGVKAFVYDNTVTIAALLNVRHFYHSFLMKVIEDVI